MPPATSIWCSATSMAGSRSVAQEQHRGVGLAAALVEVGGLGFGVAGRAEQVGDALQRWVERHGQVSLVRGVDGERRPAPAGMGRHRPAATGASLRSMARWSVPR